MDNALGVQLFVFLPIFVLQWDLFMFCKVTAKTLSHMLKKLPRLMDNFVAKNSVLPVVKRTMDGLSF